MAKDARATMSFSPDIPKKAIGFIEPFSFFGFISGRQAVHVINNQSSQNQMGNFVKLLTVRPALLFKHGISCRYCPSYSS
ncbi:hypothetical protein ACWWJF_17390 [Symbiopectobacterium sp. Eva_TO]